MPAASSSGCAIVDELLEAHAAMHARLGAPAYSVEAMADLSDGLELIVGVNVDPRFGPVAMVGLGGVYTEVLRDVAFALAPLTVERAEELLLSLRTAALLTGVRGRRAVDIKAAAAAIARDHRASPRRTRRSPRWRSTRCSCHRPARSRWTPAAVHPPSTCPA